jgi:DNA recombination-dependent growth factor C
MSLSRYRLLGGGRARYSLAKLNGLLEPYQADPVKLSGVAQEEKAGWVRPASPLDPEQAELAPDAPWDLTQCQVDDGFLLRLRMEKRTVPAQLLQLIYKQKYFQQLEKAAKGPGPKERRELRDQTKNELMARALPALSHVEGFWRDQRGELTVFAAGKKARLTFEQLFQKTFGDPLELTLVRVDPPLLGLSKEEWEDEDVAGGALGRLSLATPVTFADFAHP